MKKPLFFAALLATLAAVSLAAQEVTDTGALTLWERISGPTCIWGMGMLSGIATGPLRM